MKIRSIVGVACLAAGLAAFGARVWGGDDAPEGAPGMDPALMAPGPEHERLAELVGTWTAKGEFWMAPDKEPTRTTSTATFEMILGGRYLQQKVKGEPFMEGMPPFEGMGVAGYDRVAKQYFSTWYDNMGTGVMLSTGERSADGKTLTMSGHGDFGQGPMDFREVETRTGPKSFTMEMFVSVPGAGEMRVMRLEYLKQ